MTRGRAAVVLLTRDLRVHDNPALAAAGRLGEAVVPLFVLDPAISAGGFAAPNRMRFLHDCLADLRRSLRGLGGDLVIRRGDPVDEALGVAASVGAGSVHITADVSSYARRREQRLAAACARAGVELHVHDAAVVVAPDALQTTAGRPYQVFTPYWRAWQAAPRRAIEAPPRSVRLVGAGLRVGRLPSARSLASSAPSPLLVPGGESEARSRLATWLGQGILGYADGRDRLGEAGTSRLGPYLHFGCISPAEVEASLGSDPGSRAFLRQLAWRDFHHQTTFYAKDIARQDLRPRGDRWRHDPELFEIWASGRTGYPLVDAAMRQLQQEGWMHNRARLVTASFLSKTLHLDWREGAAHFLHWLVDGDLANNSANWQWVAGTGTDTRPNRLLNPVRQAWRFDPQGEYVRRYVPELASLQAPDILEPWRLDRSQRQRLAYPEPIVDLDRASAAFRRHRSAARLRAAPPAPP